MRHGLLAPKPLSMNEFLDQSFLDNSIRNYLIVAGLILLIFLFKKYLSRYLAGWIFRAVSSAAHGLDKQAFVRLVLKPLQGFLLIFVTLAALGKLNFPGAINFTIYRVSTREIAASLTVIILIISFFRLLLRIIDFVAMILQHKADLTPDYADNQLIVFFKDFFKVVLIINAILLILKFAFGFNIGNLVTALSIGGAAIALATRESLENLIASFIIFFDKPFRLGDLVKVQTITGTVEKIGLRSTRIRTDQKTFVTVPNKQMVDSIMDNLSLRTQRKAILMLELNAQTASSSLEAVLAQVREMLQQQEKLESSTVFLADISRSAFVIQVEFFTAPIPVADFNQLREEVGLAVMRIMEANEVRLSVFDNQPKERGI